MVITAKKNDPKKNYNNTQKNVINEEEEYQKDYLDIWRVNPIGRDFNLRVNLLKTILPIVLTFIVIYYGYVSTYNLNYTILISVFFLSILLFDQFGIVGPKIANYFRKVFLINPFRELKFFTLKTEPSVVLIANRKISKNIGIAIFKVETLPESVQPTLNQFIKAMYNSRMTFTYQVIQNPMFTSNEPNRKNIPSTISIYFSVSHSIKGVLKPGVISELVEKVREYGNELKSDFVDNIHHTKIRLLHGTELLNAMRIMIHNHSEPQSSFKRNDIRKNFYSLMLAFKILFTVTLVYIIAFILLSFKIHILIILGAAIALTYFLLFVWWRDIFYFFSNNALSKLEDIQTVDLFPDIEYFQFKRDQSILFAKKNNHILSAFKLMNLGRAVQPMLAYPDKFFRALNNHKVYFNYTLTADSAVKTKEWANSLNDKAKMQLLGILFFYRDTPTPKVKNPYDELSNWEYMRSGIWKITLTIGLACYREIASSETEIIPDLVKEINIKAKILQHAFEDNFLKLKLVETKKEILMRGFVSNSIKSLEFTNKNSNLLYLFFQGKSLMNLSMISNELKKGLETRIAAEFNTPLHLINDVIIGQTINTETLEEETELGFRYEQLKSLLITNGTSKEREHTKMKIVVELVKKGIPCVIFDYNGEWSKIVNVIEHSDIRDQFLFFKLGKTLSINLSHSDMPYDNNIRDYLNYFYDVFALSFKEQKSTIDSLRESMLIDQGISLSSIMLDVNVKSKLKIPFKESRLFNVLSGFVEDIAVLSPELRTFEHETTPFDLLKNDKTIILDFSIVKDLEQKNFFAFTILSKFIHYINNSVDFIPKVLLIPHVDLFFDAQYIDNNFTTANYGKINKFLDPLKQTGFGLIFSANQIRYLHPHLLSYFPNIITFKAIDSRDIAILKNLMNLQELHGAGYYSSKRNNTYQIDFLLNLSNNETLIKRSDIHQPFPGIIEYYEILNTAIASHDKILTYMEGQGYDLIQAEKALLAKTKKTIFEKDFGVYSIYIEGLIQFLSAIKTVHDVGNLTKEKIKKELFKYIYPTSIKRNYKRPEINGVRDELLYILFKLGYLIEAHPTRASGSQSMRTFYRVSPKYNEALDDYYASKKRLATTVAIDKVDIGKNDELSSSSIKKVILKEDLASIPEILDANYAEFFYNLFLMDQNINKRLYTEAKECGNQLISNFFTGIYQSFVKSANLEIFDRDGLKQCITFLSEEGYIPFTYEEVQALIAKSQELYHQNVNLEQTTKELYDLVSDFQIKINNHFNK